MEEVIAFSSPQFFVRMIVRPSPNHELRDIAKKLGIVVQAYSSLGSGSEQLLQHPVVLEVAEMEDRPVCQVNQRAPSRFFIDYRLFLTNVISFYD